VSGADDAGTAGVSSPIPIQHFSDGRRNYNNDRDFNTAASKKSGVQ
jgi:hypothetical protein